MQNPRVVTVAQLSDFDEIIDVRSPAEYAEDHIPGAINAPVLDDEQRAGIGTLYTQDIPVHRQETRCSLIARNIAHHLDNLFSDRPKQWKPLVYCWRGGQRSGAMAHILAQVGWSTGRLEGGYKTYRRQVMADIETLPDTLSFRVVCGPPAPAKAACCARCMNRARRCSTWKRWHSIAAPCSAICLTKCNPHRKCSTAGCGMRCAISMH